MEDEIRGLSLMQPWATLLSTGAKTIETRSWPTSYRGLMAIHASKGYPRWAQTLCRDEPFRTALLPAGSLPLGAIVAVGRLIACIGTEYLGRSSYRYSTPSRLERQLERQLEHERVFGDYSPNRFAWVFRDVYRLPEPIPCKGSMGLWIVPHEVLGDLLASRQRQEKRGGEEHG